MRLGALSDVEARPPFALWTASLPTFRFAETETQTATNYRCAFAEPQTYPAFDGSAWVIEVPSDGDVLLVDILREVDQRASKEPARFSKYGNVLIDFEAVRPEIELVSSIDFLLERRELFYDRMENARVVLSGPFWQSQSGSIQLVGAIKNRAIGTFRGYDPSLSARHLLCITGAGIQLHDFYTVAEDADPELARPGPRMDAEEVRPRFEAMGKAAAPLMDALIENECEAAFQAGPAYVEPLESQSAGRLGIGGNQTRPVRHSLLFKTQTAARERLFVLSTISPMGGFDTMTLLEGIADRILPANTDVVWAIGLQDEQQRGGPALLSPTGELERGVAMDVPTGAVLVFR